MLRKQRKHQIVCPLFLSKSSLLRIPNVISEKIVDWHQLMKMQLIRKDVERKTNTANPVAIVFEQKFALESLEFHFCKNIWLNVWKRCWKKYKNSQYCVLIVFQQKFAFESFDLNCRENNWLTSKSNVQNDWKRCSEKSKRSKYCPTVFQQKFVFDSFDLHFWENDWLTSNNDDQTDWKILREEQNQKILWPMLSKKSSLLLKLRKIIWLKRNIICYDRTSLHCSNATNWKKIE